MFKNSDENIDSHVKKSIAEHVKISEKYIFVLPFFYLYKHIKIFVPFFFALSLSPSFFLSPL